MAGKKTVLNIAGSILITILLIYIYFNIASKILFTPIDFDEGYNLQISYHLANNFRDYTTFTDKFDPNITTGPALLIPTSLFINETNPLLPRIVILFFTIIFFYICQTYIYTNKWQKIIFLILVTLTPLFYFFSSHILGEFPGFVFFLSAIVTLSKRKYFFSGILLGMSILTKQVYSFGVLSIILQFALIHIFSKKQRTTIFRNLALLFGGFVVVFLLWYGYILISVNLSYTNFKSVLNANWQSWVTLSQPKLALIDKRLEMFKYIFGINGLIFSGLIIGFSWQIIKRLRHNHIAVSLAFFSLIYTIYFLFLGSSNWYRHFYPVVLSILILLPLAGDLLPLQLSKKKLFLYLVTIIVFMTYPLYYFIIDAKKDSDKRNIEQNLIFQTNSNASALTQSDVLVSQLKTADFILKNINRNETISGISWWNAPEIEYLTKRKIQRDPFKFSKGYLITHFYGEKLGLNDYNYLNLIKNKKNVYQTNEYKIYKISN